MIEENLPEQLIYYRYTLISESVDLSGLCMYDKVVYKVNFSRLFVR